MKIKNNQDGIAHIAAVLVAVIIAVVGFVGLKVWDTKDSKNNSVAKNNTSTTKSATPAFNPNTAEAKKNIIKLPKMGIQFTVSDSLKSLDYVESTSNADSSGLKEGFGSESYPVAFVVLPSLETPECKLPEKAGGYLGTVWKVAGQYPSDATALNAPGVLAKQFSSYYISYRAPIMNCSNDTAQQAKIFSVQEELLKALKTTAEIK